MTSEQGSAHTLDARSMTSEQVVDALRARARVVDSPPLQLVVRDHAHFDEILDACRNGPSWFEPVGVTMMDIARPVFAPDPAARFETRVATLSYAGGIIGALAGSPHRHKLQALIRQYNDKGYRLVHVLPAKAGILFNLLGLVCLFLTLFLWAPQAGETLIFERRKVESPAGRPEPSPASDPWAFMSGGDSPLEGGSDGTLTGRAVLYGLFFVAAAVTLYILSGMAGWSLGALLPFVYSL